IPNAVRRDEVLALPRVLAKLDEGVDQRLRETPGARVGPPPKAEHGAKLFERRGGLREGVTTRMPERLVHRGREIEHGRNRFASVEIVVHGAFELLARRLGGGPDRRVIGAVWRC